MFTKEVKWSGALMTRCYIGKGAGSESLRIFSS